ncbi:MAG: hypothetical protein ACRYF0_14800 [Janthinobacterium lividum]
MSYIRGLDPLGTQISSEATYSLLLPGITNLTYHIRHYGFYCWLLDTYERDGGLADPVAQQNFIRRAELLLALLVQLAQPTLRHIPGSQFAAALVQQGAVPYNLSAGADLRPGGNEGTYWRSRTGAFGQYYAGAMRQLGLVGTLVHGELVYRRTPRTGAYCSGEEVAEAYAGQMPEAVQQRFLRSVQQHTLRPADVAELFRYFNPVAVAEGSPEQAVYLRLLMAADSPAQETEEPARHRATTLRELLRYLHAHPGAEWPEFLLANYVQRLTADSLTMQGWYYYQVNEYWQFACGALLSATLQQLDQAGGVLETEPFLADFAKRVGQQLRQLTPWLTPEQLLTWLVTDQASELPTEEVSVAAIWQALKNREPRQVAAHSFLLLGQLLRHTAGQMPELVAFGQRRAIYRDGNFWEFAQGLLRQPTLTVGEFIPDFLRRRVLTRHLLVATRKLGSGTQATFKFALEDDYLLLLENIQPMFSGPRLNALCTIAREVHLLDEQGRLTPRALTYLP